MRESSIFLLQPLALKGGDVTRSSVIVEFDGAWFRGRERLPAVLYSDELWQHGQSHGRFRYLRRPINQGGDDTASATLTVGASLQAQASEV